MTELKEKTVLITGASRGIGSFIAKECARRGARVVGVARDRTKLATLQSRLSASGTKCFVFAWDLSMLETLPALIEQIEQTAGTIDVLINNAGIERYRAFQDYSLTDLQDVISVNLLAAMELSRLLLPGMLLRKSGHIVNLASTAAKKGHPFDSAYSASKAGLLMWSDALRQELNSSGVKVSAICPGYVEQCGMMADTGIDAPRWAGATTPVKVAQKTVDAIAHNTPEVIIAKDALSAAINKVLFASWQFFPQWGDYLYRAIGIPQLNQQRIAATTADSTATEPLPKQSVKEVAL